MFLFFVILTVFNACIVGINSQITYNYDFGVDGKATPPWPATCDSLTIPQSPVNIVDADLMEFPYPPVLNIEMHSVKPESISPTRDGPSIDYRFKYPNNQRPTLSGGPLGNEIYTFEKLHFHWTEKDCAGSEHAINYKKYAAEAHLVYYNSKYPNIDQAANAINNDGIVVIAVLVEIAPDSGNTTKPFMNYLRNVLRAGTVYKETVNLFTIEDIIQSKYFNYFSYHGSLTTPPCSEAVKWIVAKQPLTITPAELAQFNQLRNEKGLPMTNNWRPIQEANDRIVYSY
ncbi:unnamed protein product [Diamesa hyperborea]